MRWMLLAMLCVAPAVQAQTPDGAALFKSQCGTCHSNVAGEARLGPNLAGVMGRKAGSLPGYKYSAAMLEADFAWDAAHLDPYLANPASVVKGGSMMYRQSKAEVREAIIAYLQASAL